MTEEQKEELKDSFDNVCEGQDCSKCKYDSSCCEMEYAFEKGKKEAFNEILEFDAMCSQYTFCDWCKYYDRDNPRTCLERYIKDLMEVDYGEE